MDSNIAPGICGIFLLDIIKNHIQPKQVIKLIRFIPDRFLTISITFEYIFSWVGKFIPNHIGNWEISIVSHTAKRNPCNQGAGIRVMYFIDFEKKAISKNIPLTIAIMGRYWGQWVRENHIKIPDKAHAGPNILCLLDPNIAAIPIAHIALINHCIGLHPLAIAKDIESGIETTATTNPDFQFFLIS